MIEQNPLAEGLERLPAPPTALVIFGATSDLARRSSTTSRTTAYCPGASTSAA